MNLNKEVVANENEDYSKICLSNILQREGSINCIRSFLNIVILYHQMAKSFYSAKHAFELSFIVVSQQYLEPSRNDNK